MNPKPMFWYCDCPAGQDMQLWSRESCPHCSATRDGRTSRNAVRWGAWKAKREQNVVRRVNADPILTQTRAMAIEF